MIETPEVLIAYCRESNRICPMPQVWNRLWELLPERRQTGSGWEPSLPLILAAWNGTSNLEKMVRLAEHIDWSAKHGNLAEVAVFIRKLDESQWYHFGD